MENEIVCMRRQSKGITQEIIIQIHIDEEHHRAVHIPCCIAFNKEKLRSILLR